LAALAREFAHLGVTYTIAWNIKTRKSWQDID
jgi:hypothetical protein